jgi:hypothetical protein
MRLMRQPHRYFVDLHPRGLGFEQAGHVLDTEHMDALPNELVGQIEVVLERVLRLLRVGDIARVTDGTLDDTAGFLGGVNTELEVLEIVE